MKYQNNEPYDQWVERVRMYELGIAYQRLANGEDVNRIMSDMSFRIKNKLLHPFYPKNIDTPK